MQSSRHLITVLFVISLGLPTGLAIEINLVYDDTLSEPPSFDPDGRRLGQMMQVAADYWEDIIEDDWSFDLAYTWGNLTGDGTLGVEATLDTRRGRPSSTRIRIDTHDDSANERPWFFDPTPLEHTEFDLPQVLYRDLSSTQQSSWFRGNPPQTMEVSYAGLANRSAPSEAREGFDLLSVLLHEMGHALGMTNVVAGPEVSDSDFDFPSQLVHGQQAAARTASAEDSGHLQASRTLMFPSFVEGIRRLPSATDVLSIASAARWENIDLPRKEFSLGTSWGVDANWLGQRQPDGDDEAFLRHGAQVTARNPFSVGSLSISDGSSLRIGGSPDDDLTTAFTIGETLRLAGTDPNASADVTVERRGVVEVRNLVMTNHAFVELLGGGITTNESLQIGPLSTLGGYGDVEARSLVNDGVVHADRGLLRLSGFESIDLDGTDGSGTLSVDSGRLQINRDPETSMAFGGSIVLGDEGTLSLKSNVRLLPTSRIQLKVRLDADDIGTGQLQVSEEIQLQGTVGFDVIEKHPLETKSARTVTLVQSDTAVTGRFSNDPSGHQGQGLFFDLKYEDQRVDLVVLQARPGDANGDGRFDQQDVVQVLQHDKFLSDELADWTEGDWNNAPYGGDGQFDQRDLIAALAAGPFDGDTQRASQPPPGRAAPVFSGLTQEAMATFADEQAMHSTVSKTILLPVDTYKVDAPGSLSREPATHVHPSRVTPIPEAATLVSALLALAAFAIRRQRMEMKSL